MIKVGQIYQRKINGERWVVTKGNFSPKGFDFVLGNIPICMIRNDGEVTVGSIPHNFIKNCELIAEYPTWQEAVNSKEFKND